MNRTSKMVYISLLVAQALVLYLFESMIPVPFITPGAKLGLANLIVVIGIYTLENYKDAFLVVILRLILSTMFGGNISSFLFGLAGSILSFITMIAIKEVGKSNISIIGVSATGAVFHNVGQLLVAAYMVKNIGVMLYLPVLSIAGIGTGIFIGITANYAVAHLNKLSYLKNKNYRNIT